MILWKNGILHSLENEYDVYHQMTTHQGVIVAFDDDIDISNIDEVIDLGGAHLYPGFVDSHLHLMGYGRKLFRPNLNGLKVKEDIYNIIQNHPDHQIFEGYEGIDVTKHDLDRLFSHRLIVLRHKDYHSATVSSAVLKGLGFESDTGILTEDKATKAMMTFGQVTNDDLKAMFHRALQSLYAFGVTGGHSDDLAYFNGFYDTLNAMKHVLKDHPFRTHLLMHHEILDDYIQSQFTFLDQSDYLQLGAIKIFYDGTFSSKTALVSKPYVDKTYGIRIFKPLDLERLIQKIRLHQLPIAIHVIGDQALSEVFDLFEKYPVKKGLHDRIIHASLWQDKDFERAKRLSLIFDIQPQFLSSDIPAILDVFNDRPKSLYRWRSMLEKGLIICGGSDAPVEIPNPLLGMYDAIYREAGKEVYDKSECLSRYEALKLYTTYANIPTYKTNRGQLKKGYIADFTVLKEDVLNITKSRFKDNKVLFTIINEKIVFKR